MLFKKLFVMLILTSSIACSALANTPEDGAAIRALATGQATAWNRHDAKAYAALFTVDSDVVNVVGQWWTGRTQIERKLTLAFATMFKNSTLTFTDVQVRFLTPDLAVAHMRWVMTGATPPARFPPIKQGIQTLLVRKQANAWLIDVVQNTNAMAMDNTTSARMPAAAASPTPHTDR